VTQHATETNSRFARLLLNDWEREVERFWQVVPKEYVKYLPQPMSEQAEALRA
jgi:glutamate synthase (NADPH/NADH) large chain